MLKYLFIFCFALTPSVFAQSPTPEAFLGYPLGTKFTYHHKVVEYVKTLAEANPTQVKLIPYGTTYEGRPLVVAVIASKANFPKLETIRTDNLKSIGLLEGSASGPVPAIAWMSYNVHGNEAVSSEAVMQVMYELLNPNNASMQKILSNTVVVLDPCINPDGRDRYAQWYNRVVSAQPDPTVFALEHNEPWPGGRPNHYLFDLNRDWAWQVQRESQLRLAIYQKWMPHLHADFHEMGPASSYYFPPAAKPYHKDITPWQREFNNVLGDYNKKYFDQNGWLYFTKYSFDLLYPSYGDTWPTYNGAIGMTYEQGGSGRAGLALERPYEGDTLTLSERISHHYYTSLATLEAISDRSEKTVEEFVRFHKRAVENPNGIYKSYLIKASGKFSRQVRDFLKLLDKQQIKYGLVDKTGTLKGINLLTNKEETVASESTDIVISAYQPTSSLLKILMETQPELEDSLTYDITAWGMSYAYHLQAYGLKDRLNVKPYQAPTVINTVPSTTPYAYLVDWGSFNDARFLADLHKAKIRVRTTQAPFTLDGKEYGAGTLVITHKGNEALGRSFDERVVALANAHQVQLTVARTGMVEKGSDLGSGDVVPMKAPKVVALMGEGVNSLNFGEVWHYFDQQLGYPLTLVEAAQLRQINWSAVDVLILPAGNYSRYLSENTMQELTAWIQKGGKVVALEGAVQQFIDAKGYSLKRKKSADTEKEQPLKRFGDRERAALSEETSGSIYQVQLDPTHPLAFGYGDSYYALINSIYELDYLPNGWNVGYLTDANHRAGFVGSKAKAKLKNTLIFGVENIGRGEVVYLSNNPLFRGFWQEGKLLFSNAVFR